MSAGASSVIVPADDKALDTPMDYESTQNILNAPLGSASVIILDDSVNMAWLVDKTVTFLPARILRKMYTLPRRNLSG